MSTEEVRMLTKNYHDLTHDFNAFRQSSKIDSENIREVKYALLGNEEFNQVGLVQQIKNHQKLHIELDKRVSDIEQVKKIEEKLLTYKKGLFGVVFGSIGAGILMFIKAVGAFFLEHFK